ncbi:MAG: MFS transporter [Actinomycetia bacterium]|nr:MFS transporter [Actinomycetes bacterium]
MTRPGPSDRSVSTAESETRWGLIVSGWSVYAIYYLGRVNFSVAVPGLGDEQGLEATKIGTLAAGFFWVYSLSAVPIGRLADRIGARLLVGLGLVGSGIMNVLFILTIQNFTLSLVFWSANGIFQAMGWTPLIGAVGRWVDERGAGRVIASFGSCFVAGTALTFAIGGFLVERTGVETLFLAAAAVLVPVGIAWWIGARDPVKATPASEQTGGPILRSLGALPPAVAIGAAYVALIVWTPAYFVEVHNETMGRSGLLSAALPAIAIGATITLGRWFQHSRGPGSALRGGVVLMVTSMALALVSQVSGLAAGFAAVAAATALVGASSSLVLGLFPRMTSPARVALVSGIYALAFNLGGGSASPVMGGLVDRDAWDGVFLFLAALVLLGALWTLGWYVWARSHLPTAEPAR